MREKSEIHYGTSILRIEEKAKQLEGTYFTDRNTTGDIILPGIELKKQKVHITNLKIHITGNVEIRRIEHGDENQVSNLIRKTISISNIKDYLKELMDALIAVETPEHVLERASWTHFYVVIDEDEIIGCGAIGPGY